jgi:hypothetical protein
VAGKDIDHPLAMNVLLWGIFGVSCCAVGAPIAWIRGRRVLREIAASGGTMGGRSAALIGYVLGILGTLYYVIVIAAGITYIVVERKP